MSLRALLHIPPTTRPLVQVDADVSFGSQLKRTALQLDQRTATIKTVLERPMELPAVDDRKIGRKHDHVYGYTADFDAPGIGICKVRSSTRAFVPVLHGGHDAPACQGVAEASLLLCLEYLR